MKFTIVFILTGLSMITAAAVAGVMTVSVDSATGSPGSKVFIPITVNGASNLGAMDVVVTYDPTVLKFSGADLGELSTNGMIDSNSPSPGTVKIGVVDTKGVSGNGALIKMNFDVIGHSGSNSPVSVQVTGAWNLDLVDVLTSVSGGTVSVGGGKTPLSEVSILGAICVAIVIIGTRIRRPR